MHYTNWGDLLSKRFPISSPADTERDWAKAKERISLHQTVTGVVVAKAPFGAWIDIGAEFPALLQIVCMVGMTTERYKADDWCPVGSKVTAYIAGFNDQNQQIVLCQPGSSISPFPAK